VLKERKILKLILGNLALRELIAVLALAMIGEMRTTVCT